MENAATAAGTVSQRPIDAAWIAERRRLLALIAPGCIVRDDDWHRAHADARTALPAALDEIERLRGYIKDVHAWANSKVKAARLALDETRDQDQEVAHLDGALTAYLTCVWRMEQQP